MKLAVFTVRDDRAGVFAHPLFVAHKDLGVRAFIQEANDPQSYVGKHARDLSLWYLGEFDDNAGQFEVFSVPELIGSAVSFIKQEV